jgi:hypothetical protein
MRLNLRYQGITEKAPAPGSRRNTQWITSIQSKQRDKYETNEISENVNGCGCLRSNTGNSARATDYDNNHDSGPGNRHNDNSSNNDKQCRHDCDIYAGFGLFHVSNGAECCTNALLLHERHGHCGSGRPHHKLVGDSTRHAGDHLLHDGW